MQKMHLLGENEVVAAYLISRLYRGTAGAGGNQESPRATCVICPDLKTAEALSANVEFFLGEGYESNTRNRSEIGRFLSWEVLPFDALSPTQAVSAERLSALSRLAAKENLLLITTVEALMQCVVSRELLSQGTTNVYQGEHRSREEVVDTLIHGGYTRSTLVEECGQFAVRGAVVDFFPGGVPRPLRLEFLGDVIESIREFDSSSQRSLRTMDHIVMIPVREFLLSTDQETLRKGIRKLRDRAAELGVPERVVANIVESIENRLPFPGMEHLQPFFNTEQQTLFHFLLPNTEVVLYREGQCHETAERIERLVQERALRLAEEGVLFPISSTAYLSAEMVRAELQTRATKLAPAKGSDILPNAELRHQLLLHRHKPLPLQPLADEIIRSQAEGLGVAITVSQEHRRRRIAELLRGYDLPSIESDLSFPDWFAATHSGGTGRSVTLLDGALGSGFRAVQDGFQLISDSEIFPEITVRRRIAAPQSVRRILGALSQLKENDFIVHVDHGVGIYRGLREMAVEGQIGDFLHLEYADEAKLFLPVENIGKIQKYIGAEGKKPTLSRLGGTAWMKTRRTVEEAVTELAGQLIHLYAAREAVPGFSFGEMDEQDLQFADSFPFEETPDQRRAIEEVLRDMGREKPMDRLVCGDVGYGKTEVALRAAFKAVSGGKQVGVLVPTTILADQHYQTFRTRLSDFGLRVGAVSRFFSAAENKQTLEQVRAGSLDIVIGTHRLLQRDVFFKDLGLLIIDEEHRFGVAHKERLRRLRKEVDVLTLTATPIPRTLHMSLSGIKDLSIIETPPIDRQVIKTFVSVYQPDTVKEAILRELGRGGQVFYIYNRVETIHAVADEVRNLVPEARIAVGHGQMDDDELENIMHRFIQGEVDVLVSTTIVESGLDIPNANTIIIRKAEAFGLAELYQLRGRVGRSSRRAYAYLLISDPRTLGPDARRRLEVLQSLDDLGMGFRLAVQDMEIRGAGNLLGRDQSGSVNLVGYEMYTRILKDAVREIRLREEGQPVRTGEYIPEVDPEIHIGFAAHIPSFYVPDVEERLILYQRLVGLRDAEQGRQIYDEIEDRFGRLPPEVETLVEVMVFRALLRRAGIVSASYRNDVFSVIFHPEVQLDPKKVIAAVQSSKSKLRLLPNNGLSFTLMRQAIGSPNDLTRALEAVFREIGLPLTTGA